VARSETDDSHQNESLSFKSGIQESLEWLETKSQLLIRSIVIVFTNLDQQVIMCRKEPCLMYPSHISIFSTENGLKLKLWPKDPNVFMMKFYFK
jgi:hypothetical protein